jgi:hypothetical protein
MVGTAREDCHMPGTTIEVSGLRSPNGAGKSTAKRSSS